MQEKNKILSLHINPLSFTESIEKVAALGLAAKPSFVCFANVHMVMEAKWDPVFQQQVNKADLVLADGKPISVACSILNGKVQERIAGMDFMPSMLARMEALHMGVFFYGSTPTMMNALFQQIKIDYPRLEVKGFICPPFRPLEAQEIAADIATINDSGARVVMISLGCPKQEKWMADNYKKINAVLLGVGAAFSVMARVQKRAPLWMQQTGLEWLFRLGQEPGRLFKRYAKTNLAFVWLLLLSVIKTRLK